MHQDETASSGLRRSLHRYTLIFSVLSLVTGVSVLRSFTAHAELNPGDRLSRENWGEAQGFIPEPVLRRFQAGGYRAKIVTLPETVDWGKRFKAASEGNVSQFSVDADGRLIDSTTQTYPPFLYGYPFPRIEPQDPQAALKAMYNFSYVLMQPDDAKRLSNLHWVSPSALERRVEFKGNILFYGSRFSGPIENPDDALRKITITGVAPNHVVGVATLEWNYLDPQKWNAIWSYLSQLRRVRRLPSIDGSSSLFGSDLSHDDLYLFSGKVSYFDWKLIGVQEALVPYTLPNPKRLQPREQGYVLENPADRLVMGWEKADWDGVAWWPVNVHLARRPVWVVEATPKDPAYAYSRQVLWIDRELYIGYYKVTYDKAGQLWRTLLNSVSIGKTADSDFSVAQPDFLLSVDEQHDQATVELSLTQGHELSFNVGLTGALFTPAELAKRDGR